MARDGDFSLSRPLESQIQTAPLCLVAAGLALEERLGRAQGISIIAGDRNRHARRPSQVILSVVASGKTGLLLRAESGLSSTTPVANDATLPSWPCHHVLRRHDQAAGLLQAGGSVSFPPIPIWQQVGWAAAEWLGSWAVSVPAPPGNAATGVRGLQRHPAVMSQAEGSYYAANQKRGDEHSPAPSSHTPSRAHDPVLGWRGNLVVRFGIS